MISCKDLTEQPTPYIFALGEEALVQDEDGLFQGAVQITRLPEADSDPGTALYYARALGSVLDYTVGDCFPIQGWRLVPRTHGPINRYGTGQA